MEQQMIDFGGRHFPSTVILMAIRWYVAYALSYRDIEELMAERGLEVDHSTVNRWVIRYSPELEDVFRKNKKPVGTSWRMDETYVKVQGEWMYQYRAVDKEGRTVDFLFSKQRDRKAAKKFFLQSISTNGRPEKVNIDKSGANKAGLEDVNKDLPEQEKIFIRQCKYLNNIVEQDHRFVKKITRQTLGFKSYAGAEGTLAGIELHRMLRKGQYQYGGGLTVFEQFFTLAG